MEEKKPFFKRLKEELEEERNKPIRLSPLNILYIALLIIVLLAFVLLAFYILKNISLLNTDPCSLCEKAGNICSKVIG
jgi:hypothetical protein